jgi:hypothetical protein
MDIPQEISAPEGWTEVRIGTKGVEPDLVADLEAQLAQTGISLEITRDGFVVRRGVADELSLSGFEAGIVPDLVVRGFTVAWETRGL